MPDETNTPSLQPRPLPPDPNGSPEATDKSNEAGNKESETLFRQGRQNLEQARKNGDLGAALMGIALLLGAIFALRRQRRETTNSTQQMLAETGGFDPRIVDDPEATLKEIDAQHKTSAGRGKDLQDTIAKLETDLKAQSNAGSTVALQLRRDIENAQQEAGKITGEGAQLGARIARLKIEQGRRQTIVQSANKSLTAVSPARNLTLQGNRLTIDFRDPITGDQNERLENIRKQFGGYGVTIGMNQDNLQTVTLTVPAEFWSEWTSGLASTGRGARLAIFSFLTNAGESTTKQTEEKTKQSETKTNQNNTPNQPTPPSSQETAKNQMQKQQNQEANDKGHKQAEQKIVNNQVMKDQEMKKQEIQKSSYSAVEFLRNPTENIAQILEQHASGQTVDIRTSIRRIDEAYTICGKMYDEAFKTQWDSSSNESSLGWAHVAALREAESAPVFHPKQVAEYRAKERAAKKAYEDAQQQTKALTQRRDRLFTMQHTTIRAEQQRRDAIVGSLGSVEGSRDSNVWIVCPATNTDGTLAMRELLGVTVPAGGRFSGRIEFPASAWKEQPDASGPTIAMVLKITRGQPLTPQEETALAALAPITTAVRRFNRRSQMAEFVIENGQPSIRINMSTSHPQYAETSKRFVAAVEPIIPIAGVARGIYRFGEALLNPQTLDRIAEAIEGNKREVSPEQADREVLLIMVDRLGLQRSRLGYTRERCARLPNAIVVEKIIEALSERTTANAEFMNYSWMYCDEQGNLRTKVNPPAEGSMLVANWATAMRATPTVGAAMLADIRWQSDSDRYSPLRSDLEALARTTVTTRVTDQRQEYNRRASEIAVADVYSAVENRLHTRIQCFQTTLAQRDNISLGERISEVMIFGSLGTAYDLSRMAGLDLPGDIRPSSAIRDIRKRTQDALKVNTALLEELRNMQFSGTPTTTQISLINDIVGRMADLNFTDINRRLQWCRTYCNIAERGLEYADMAAESFAGRAPVVGPILYATLRNGVGMMAGEQIRNSDGTYRPRDWGDFAINVGVAAIPIPGNRTLRMIPGYRSLERAGTRFALQFATRELVGIAKRNMIRSILDEAKDRLKAQLELVAKMVREGKSADEIWDVVSSQEPDYVGWITGTAIRMISSSLGNAAGKYTSDMVSNVAGRLTREGLQKALQGMNKQISDGTAKATTAALEKGTKMMIEEIATYEENATD